MKVLRRFCALGVAGMMVGATLAGAGASTASAQTAPSTPAATPEVFAGSASATALSLSLLGINLTVSHSDASADSTPKASADATLVSGSIATLDATTAAAPVGGNTTFTSSPTGPGGCNLSVPVQGILTIGAACSQSAAAVPPSPAPTACNPVVGVIAPTACGRASVLDIDVGLTQLLAPLLDAVKGLTSGLSTTIGTVLSSIPVVSPLLQGLLTGQGLLAPLGLNLADPISSLISAIERATELLSIHVLPAGSAVTTAAGAVVAAAQSDVLDISLLPNLLLDTTTTPPTPEPLLSVTVAGSESDATYNRVTCQSTAAFHHASVLSIGGLLKADVALGTLNLAGILSVTLGGGTTTQNADGSMSASAEGLGVNLLNGVVKLDVGATAATAGGKCAFNPPIVTTTTTTLPIVTSPPQPIKLATTGTSAPLLPVGFILILAGYLTRRSFRSRKAGRASR